MTQKPKKFIIFDAGPIISLTMNGLLGVLARLKNNFNGEFIITPTIKKEVIDKPLTIKKYELEGVKVKNLLDKGVLTLSSKFISNNQLSQKTKQIMEYANSLFRANGEKINLIHEGEASCLAFSTLCGCDSVIVIDERTTRMLTEAPENLKKIMEKKLHTAIEVNHKDLKEFKDFRFIRSSELLYIAYKRDLFDLTKDKVLLDALLYGVKFKGAAISSHEIEEIKKLA